MVRFVDCENQEMRKNEFMNINFEDIKNQIIHGIERHRNELFDWILDERKRNEDKCLSLFADFAIISVLNVNLHCLAI